MTKKQTLTMMITSAALILGLTAGIASAQKDGALRFDTNGDKQISQSEFLSGAEARFNEMDVNGDNLISDDEQNAHRESRKNAHLDERFKRADKNNDGVISKDELKQMREAKDGKKGDFKQKMRGKLDLNGDGTVDDAEKAEARETFKARKTGQKERYNAFKETKRDANGDGFISREEHTAASINMFKFLDANDDGVLTEGEGKKRKKRRGKKGPRP